MTPHAQYAASLPADEANRVEYAKQNVVLIGPTGVGKTYLVKHIADLIGVPFVKADATKFSETGYVGGDVEDLVRELVHKADGDLALAQSGIIYIDESSLPSLRRTYRFKNMPPSSHPQGLLVYGLGPHTGLFSAKRPSPSLQMTPKILENLQNRAKLRSFG